MLLSVYDSGYKHVDHMLEDYNMPPIIKQGLYYPPGFITLLPIQFTELDEYQTFLVPTEGDKSVQHFTVVIKRIPDILKRIAYEDITFAEKIVNRPKNKDSMVKPRIIKKTRNKEYDLPVEYYSMGFSFGPEDNYVLASPDFYFYTIEQMNNYQHVALQPFTRLGPLVHKLNQLLQGYNHGGYYIYNHGHEGYFAFPNVHVKFNLLRRTCLTGFDSVFPIPTKCLHRGERLSYYLSTGKTKKKKRRRKRIKKTHRAL